MTPSKKITAHLVRACALTVVILLPFGTTAQAEHREFSHIVAFGDSLMDSGNAFVLTGEIATPPFEPVPSAAYAIGGHHFSNGNTWVESLGKALGLQQSTGPSARNPGVFFNYAVGGSRAREDNRGVSSAQQVLQHLGSGQVSPNALYVFGFGSNDVRDALQAGPVAGPAILGNAVTAIAGNLYALCSSGARHILVPSVANIGTTPFAQALGEPVISAATRVSGSFNGAVQQSIAALVQPACPDTRFYMLDLYSLSTSVFAYPSGFGFADANSCLVFGTTGNAICPKPNSKFFWDAIHPTKTGHELIAAEAKKLLIAP